MRQILYLGTHPFSYPKEGSLIHYPVIKIIPRKIPSHILDDIPEYTHLIFTSKNAVTVFFEAVGKIDLSHKTVIALGRTTASRLDLQGHPPTYIAEEESQEGVISLMRPMDLNNAYVFLPRSSLARHTLENFLIEQQVRHQICDLYDTVAQKIEPLPDLEKIDEIVFTSPSTVRAFLEVFSFIPKDKTLTCLGLVTQEELQKFS